MRISCLVTATLLCASGCTALTSVHGGYGVPTAGGRGAGGIEIRRTASLGLHEPGVLAGLRGEASERRQEGALQVGGVWPVRLAETVSLVPFATVELARATRIDGSWYGGAGGPGAGTELVWWWRVQRRHKNEPGAPFGCFGGYPGYDCPSVCVVEDVVRDGIGVRVAAEYDVRFGSRDGRHLHGGVVWLTAGVTRASSRREKECCHFTVGHPSGKDCDVLPQPGLLR
jgi:hypothetical protein